MSVPPWTRPHDEEPGCIAGSAIPALDCSGVGKQYAGAPALIDVSLKVTVRQIAGLVGMNGAGKTTLLKCILDFCRFDAGCISVRHRL